MFAGLKSFGDALTAYINNSNSREYYNGRLVHSWPLSPVPGRYTSFTVYVYTASSTSTSQRMDTVVTVGKCNTQNQYLTKNVHCGHCG